MDAYGLTGLACALVAAFDAGVRATMTYPNEPQVREHLARMGLRDLLRALGYDDGLPQTKPIDRPDVLLPLSRIDRVFAAEQLSSLLHEQLRDQAAPETLEAALEGLWELAANAVEHSGAAALIMGQVYRHGDPPHHRNRIQVVIGDAGKGIRTSLIDSGRHDPPDDESAIDLALEYLVTSVDDPGRGQGLYTTMEQVTALEGQMIVRSGPSRVTYGAGGREHEGVSSLPGTLVCISLPPLPWAGPMTTLEVPAHAGSREQAQALAAVLPTDLSATPVMLDCSSMTVGAPSFLDEIVKQILVLRSAPSLTAVGASERARTLLRRAATNRQVADRLLPEQAAA